MDYKELKEKIDYLDYMTEENIEDFIEARDTIHYCVKWLGEEKPSGGDLQAFADAIDYLEERGAVRGRDYIICAFLYVEKNEDRSFSIVLHSKRNYLSDEDFPINIKRTNNENKNLSS